MQVAKYHTNYIGYCFHLVAHAATGTPNLYVGEKKGRKDSPLKGDFDSPFELSELEFLLEVFQAWLLPLKDKL